jgi:hypothetical protein
MKRWITHMAATSDDVYAECNDGTFWVFFANKWHALSPIPQDPEAPEVTELRKFVEGNGE